MLTLFVIVIKVLLAFYILSILYLLIIYYLKNLIAPSKHIQISKSFLSQPHIAIIYNGITSEKDLIQQIQILKQQAYQNYSAYFFVEDQFVELNTFQNIHLTQVSSSIKSPFELIVNASRKFSFEPDAVFIVNTQSVLPQNFLSLLSRALNEGVVVGQCRIETDNSSIQGFQYQQFSKRIFNIIDRETLSEYGISAALWNHGFIIDYSIFKSLSLDNPSYSDKDLQIEIISKSIHIHYLKNIYIKESPLSIQKYLSTRTEWFFRYFFQIQVGFRLLLEAVKTPNLDKIIFGFNYLRPPVWLMLIASLGLLLMDYFNKNELAVFTFVAILGVVLSVSMLFNSHYFQKKLPRLFMPKQEKDIWEFLNV